MQNMNLGYRLHLPLRHLLLSKLLFFLWQWVATAIYLLPSLSFIFLPDDCRQLLLNSLNILPWMVKVRVQYIFYII